jgi:hypothetical protein
LWKAVEQPGNEVNINDPVTGEWRAGNSTPGHTLKMRPVN